MKRALFALGLVSAALVGGNALACGDKFLVVGRNVRAQRLRGAVHHASILVYRGGTGRLDAAIRETGLDRELTLAGHKLQSVSDRGQFDAALASGRYDVVLADIGDMKALEPFVAMAPRRPSLLPVIYDPTGEELAAAKQEYSCVMRSPSTQQGYLAVIEDALSQREKRAAAESH